MNASMRELYDGLFVAIKDFCSKTFEPRQDAHERRIQLLEQRLEELAAERALPGQDGRDGRDGLDGAPGRDGLQIDVLDGIDSTRTYRRGTYARHAGGTVRAFRTTDPLDGDLEKAGWHVITCGIGKLELFAIDDRSDLLRVTMTGGERVEHAIPKLNYRGLYRLGEYERGDCVTHAGSVWHCERATSQAPKEGEDWVLMVKEGRPGRDAKGQPAPDGKPRYLGAHV